MFKKLSIIAFLFAGLIFTVQAQEKTEAELKAERDALKAELKAQAAVERKAKIEKMTQPKTSGVQSVDDLSQGMGKLVTSTNENNKLIPDLYKRTIGETIDGITEVNLKKPTLGELTEVSTNISAQIKSANDIMAAVPDAANDVSKASPMQAPKAKKALDFVKEAGPMVLPELELNLKAVNHLITTAKSTKNY